MAGVKKVNSKLDKMFDNIRLVKTEKATFALASEGLAISDTKTPIDTSNLVNSHYAPIIRSEPTGTFAYAGYTANYAGFVHNKSGKLKGQPRKNGNGVYWGPNGEPEFLLKGFEEVKKDAKLIIRRIYRAK